jgi:hypothetical protein
MVVGEHRHRGIEAAVLEGQLLDDRPHHRGRALGALGDHHLGRLHGHHVQVPRLVRSGAGAHVQDGARVTERGADARRDPRILAAHGHIALADGVVEETHTGIFPVPRAAVSVRVGIEGIRSVLPSVPYGDVSKLGGVGQAGLARFECGCSLG